MNKSFWPMRLSNLCAVGFIGLLLLILLGTGRTAAQQKKKIVKAETTMVPMDQIGPQSKVMDSRPYARVIHVAAGEKHPTVAAALASVTDASPSKRYAILVAAGTYKESRIAMKPYVDLYGGFAAGALDDSGSARVGAERRR